jgi:chromate transporter
MKTDLLLAMGLTFFTTAIFSVGGISAMIPEVHRQVVEVHGWLGNDTFASAFALSQIAPGPNISAGASPGGAGSPSRRSPQSFRRARWR